MARDIRFEIEFLLSLTVGVLGFVAIRNIREAWNNAIGYLFLLFISLHMIGFITYYVYNNATSLNIPVIQRLERLTRYTLMAITGLFLFLVAHISFSGIFIALQPCDWEVDLLSWWCTPYNLAFFSLLPARTFLTLLVPFLSVLTLGSPLLILIPTLRLFSDINIIISPPEIDIYDNYTNTKPLSITLQNGKDDGKTREFTVSIDPPEEVLMRYDDEEDKIREVKEFSSDIELDSRREDTFNFELKYEGEEYQSDSIDIVVSHRSVSKEKSVETVLYPP